MAQITGSLIPTVVMHIDEMVFKENPAWSRREILIGGAKRTRVHDFPPYTAMIDGERASFCAPLIVRQYPIAWVPRNLPQFLAAFSTDGEAEWWRRDNATPNTLEKMSKESSSHVIREQRRRKEKLCKKSSILQCSSVYLANGSGCDLHCSRIKMAY
jgi:hypothetical protein